MAWKVPIVATEKDDVTKFLMAIKPADVLKWATVLFVVVLYGILIALVIVYGFGN